MRPLYRSAAAALETIVPAPQGKGPAKLWYDDSQVAVLPRGPRRRGDDPVDPGHHHQGLIDAGFEPDSVIAAVEAEDRSLLKHSGLYSVQLQKPGTTLPDRSMTP
jgi:hypothetical protein